VALAVQDYVAQHELVPRCARLGEWMLERMKPLGELPIVGEVRGKGLLLGMEFVADKETRAPFDPAQGVTARIVERAFAKGVLVMPGAPGLIEGVKGDHIAISPPFTVSEAQAEEIVRVVQEAITEVGAEVGY